MKIIPKFPSLKNKYNIKSIIYENSLEGSFLLQNVSITNQSSLQTYFSIFKLYICYIIHCYMLHYKVEIFVVHIDLSRDIFYKQKGISPDN